MTCILIFQLVSFFSRVFPFRLRAETVNTFNTHDANVRVHFLLRHVLLDRLEKAVNALNQGIKPNRVILINHTKSAYYATTNCHIFLVHNNHSYFSAVVLCIKQIILEWSSEIIDKRYKTEAHILIFHTKANLITGLGNVTAITIKNDNEISKKDCENAQAGVMGRGFLYSK